ncbi:translation initiation factor IF-1 [Burkholderia sp. BCC0322]|uniref:translation initiation factor IF-1 n=1 Tax=unclassified Burkholderia TaxID=2613784 RepID=UPI00158A1D58|nr:translation initiation factor IF-1 [Burkholderia sp. BCC0322]
MGATKEERLEPDGVVDEVLSESRFRVTLENGATVAAHASERMRRHRIGILAGARVRPALSAYDRTNDRIDFRHGDDRAPAASTTKRFVRRSPDHGCHRVDT